MVSEYILGFAANRYGFNRETLEFIAEGNYSSKQFYSFNKADKTYILRVVKNSENDVAQTRAEMDWLCYLSEKGINVSRPLKTLNEELAVLAEENEETFIITACSKAEGRSFDTNKSDLWNKKVFYNWGKVIGDMHCATKDYKPASETDRRPEFTNFINESVKIFPTVNKAAEELIAEIMALPKGRDSYGLVHSDLGPANFMIDGEQINVFDFDDCKYAWFALDIAAALTFGMWFGRFNNEGYDFANDIFKHFLAGYRSANFLDDFWLSKIPIFLKLYQIAGFAYTHQSVNPNDDTQNEQMLNIENNILYTGYTIDYSLFSNSTHKGSGKDGF